MQQKTFVKHFRGMEMYILRNWHLTMHEDVVIGHGDCFGNPKLPEGLHVHTSSVIKCENDFDKNELRLFTKSGSCYHLPYAEINDGLSADTQAAAEALGISLDVGKCAECRREEENGLKRQLADILNCRELFVQMTGGDAAFRAYYKTADGVIIDAPIHVHTGMFTDSVLIGGGSALCECDWRFFPRGGQIECYQWAGELEAVRLENLGTDFIYRGYSRDILCKHGEMIVVTKEDFAGEGVFSPDAVRINRGCLLSQEEADIFLGTAIIWQ